MSGWRGRPRCHCSLRHSCGHGLCESFGSYPLGLSFPLLRPLLVACSFPFGLSSTSFRGPFDRAVSEAATSNHRHLPSVDASPQVFLSQRQRLSWPIRRHLRLGPCLVEHRSQFPLSFRLWGRTQYRHCRRLLDRPWAGVCLPSYIERALLRSLWLSSPASTGSRAV